MPGFCKYCGEISERCQCVSSRRSSVQSKAVQALRASGSGMLAKDRWGSRYTEKRMSNNNLASIAEPPRPSPSRLRLFDIPTPSSPPPSTEAEMEAFLSHSFGSVLDPMPERQRWRCSSCEQPFRRDSTLYPAETPDTFFCKLCYASRKSKGACGSCSKAVLGDVPFITKGTAVWHSSCANCSYCNNNISTSPTVDLTGHLCCDACFSSLAWRNPPKNPQPSPQNAQSRPSPSPSHSCSPLRPRTQQKNPAIDALRQNFTSVGLEKPAPSQSSKLSPNLPEPPSTHAPSPLPPLPSTSQPEHPRSPSPEIGRHSRSQSASGKSEAHCDACSLSLFSVAHQGSKIIKLHDGTKFHSACFKCHMCAKAFANRLQYALENGAPVHPECLPEPEPVPVSRPSQESSRAAPPAAASLPPVALPKSRPLPSLDSPGSPSRRRPYSSRSNTPDSLPVLSKLGKSPTCASCSKSITFLDRKVNANGLDWHAPCCKCCSCGVQLESPRIVDGVPKCASCRFSHRI